MNSSNTSNTIQELPVELFVRIIDFLNNIEKVLLSSVCKEFHEIVKTFHPIKNKDTPKIVERKYRHIKWYAFETNSLPILQYFENLVEIQSLDFAVVCNLGHLDIVKWLIPRNQQKSGFWLGTAFDNAAKRGHINILEYLNNLKSQYPSASLSCDVCSFAAYYNQLATLKWLRSQSPPFPWSVQTSNWAVIGGNLEILKWLGSQNPPCEWDDSTTDSCRTSNNIEILRWLRSQTPPCPWTLETQTFGAQHDIF